MRVFLDANILFSASLPRSRMRDMVDFLVRQSTCLTNAYAVEEARRNLESKAPHSLPALAALIDRCELVFQVAGRIDLDLKSKDLPILGGAIAGAATHLLTGDERDFGHLFGKTIGDVKIVSPKLLADELVSLGLL